MNQIVKALKEQEAYAVGNGLWKLEQLYKMAALEIEAKAARIATLTAANDYANNLLEEQGTHINEQSLKIASLTKANESMQEDAVQNTYAFGLMLKANKEQAAYIEWANAKIKELEEK